MLQYLIDSFQHRDVELNVDATFPSLTTGYCQRIKSQLCLKWYNKYTVQCRFLSCWSGKLVFIWEGVGAHRSPPASSTIAVMSESDRCPSLLRRVRLRDTSSVSDVSSTLDSLDDKTPRKTNNDINNYYYYNKNNFTHRRIFRVPLHRSENFLKKKTTLCQRWELSSGWDSTVMEDQGWEREPKTTSSSLPGTDLTCLGPVFIFCPLGAWNTLHIWRDRGSVTLARLAAHLSEVRAAAELELQYQRAVGHFVYIFAF